jgi:hypothetical protein
VGGLQHLLVRLDELQRQVVGARAQLAHLQAQQARLPL